MAPRQPRAALRRSACVRRCSRRPARRAAHRADSGAASTVLIYLVRFSIVYWIAVVTDPVAVLIVGWR